MNGFYLYGPNTKESDYVAAIDIVATNGYLKYWDKIIIEVDDGWPLGRIGGHLTWNTAKYPHGLPWLFHYAHTNGILTGLYTEPNAITSAGFVGSGTNYGDNSYIETDVADFISWGVDFIRDDIGACYAGHSDAGNLFIGNMAEQTLAAIQANSNGTNVGLICSGIDPYYAPGPLPEAANIWAGLYQTWLGDLEDQNIPGRWTHFDRLVWAALPISSYSGPGHYYTLQMPIGDYSSGNGFGYLSVNAILASSINVSSFYVRPEDIYTGPGSAYITNVDFISIAQDPLGKSGWCIQSNAASAVFVRELSNGDRAVCQYNRSIAAYITNSAPNTINTVLQVDSTNGFSAGDSLTLLAWFGGYPLPLGTATITAITNYSYLVLSAGGFGVTNGTGNGWENSWWVSDFKAQNIGFDVADLGLGNVTLKAKDVWYGTNFTMTGTYTNSVPAYSATLLRVYAPVNGVEIPQLTIIPSGPYILLTWPTNATGFTLQSTTNLGSSAFWTTVSPGPVVIGGENVVINTISGAQKFYRLSQ